METTPAYAVTKVRAGVHPETGDWVAEVDVVEDGSAATNVRTGDSAQSLAQDITEELSAQYAFLPEAWEALASMQQGLAVGTVDFDDAYPEDDEEPEVRSLPELIEQLIDVAAQGDAPSAEEAAQIVASWFGVEVRGERIEAQTDRRFGPYAFVETTPAHVVGWLPGDEEPVEGETFYALDGRWVTRDGDTFDRITVLPGQFQR
jgi:hypothetical protein